MYQSETGSCEIAPNADKEEWDIFEENDYSPLGDTMYQSVFDSLQMKTLVLNPAEDVSNGEKLAAPSSSNSVVENGIQESPSMPNNAVERVKSGVPFLRVTYTGIKQNDRTNPTTRIIITRVFLFFISSLLFCY